MSSGDSKWLNECEPQKVTPIRGVTIIRGRHQSEAFFLFLHKPKYLSKIDIRQIPEQLFVLLFQSLYLTLSVWYKVWTR